MIAFVFHPSSRGTVSRLYSAKVRLDGWAKPRVFTLHVSDKRVAEQKLWEIVQEFEREAAGILAPRLVRNAAQKPLGELLAAFLEDVAAKQRAANTLKAYRRVLARLFVRCRWHYLRDVTPRSFTVWRASANLSPKFLNDALGYMGSFLNWLVSQNQLLANPLRDVEKVAIKRGRGHRRALSGEEIARLLGVVPQRRATVYLMAIYTGLRRLEFNRLIWGDFSLEAPFPSVRVPDSISKGAKSATLGLRPELVEALRAFRPEGWKPGDLAFHGRVPNMKTFKRDLARAGIAPMDDQGRKVDFHALRTTFCSQLQANGVSPRAAMALMRHSDMKLTMVTYTDAQHLPLASELARLPSYSVPNMHAQLHEHAGDFSGQNGARPAAADHLLASAQPSSSVAFSTLETLPETTGRALKLVDSIRIELTTSSMPLRRSSN